MIEFYKFSFMELINFEYTEILHGHDVVVYLIDNKTGPSSSIWMVP